MIAIPYAREAKIIGIVVVAVLLFVSGWTVCGYREAAKREKQIREAIEAYASKQEDVKVIEREIVKTVTEVKNVYVPIIQDAANTDLCSDDFLRLFNRAAGAYNEPPGKLDAAVRQNDGRKKAK